MELFNAIFETLWTFLGTVIILSILACCLAVSIIGFGKLSLIKIQNKVVKHNENTK